MPDLDHPWLPTDYAAAVQVIRPIAQHEPAALPRYGSRKSGALFARMTSLKNLAGASAAVGWPRVELLEGYLNTVSDLQAAYFHASRASRPYGPEVASIQIFELRAAVLTADTVHGLASLSAEKDQPQLQRGVTAVLEGLEQMGLGVLHSLIEQKFYPDSDRLRIAEALQSDLPPLANAVDPATRRELLARVRSVHDSEPSREIRGVLEGLASALDATAGRPSTTEAGQSRSEK
jgi:hypothetical protein